MAVQFTQTPSSPNGTQSSIVYVVNNLNTTGSQAKYILDVRESGSADILVRLKQPPNNSNLGVFEISDILHDYIEYDEPWLTETPITSSNNTKTFSIEFGEQSSASISGSLFIFANQINDEIVVYPAVTDYEEGLNWDSGSYLKNYLTNSPDELYVRNGDYGTLSIPNYSGSVMSDYDVNVYNESDVLIDSHSFSLPGNPSNAEQRLVHIPSGPKNLLTNLSVLGTDTWSYYEGIITDGVTTQTKRFYRLDDCVEENGMRFAFINRLGVFDYYTTELTNTEEQSFNSQTYRQTFIDYSTTDGTVPYERSRRGDTIYNKTIDTRLTAQTNWLSKEQADWLMELFQSPEVFVQRGDTFLPVIIENTTERKKTNPRGQKLFTYQIQYRIANPKRSRR